MAHAVAGTSQFFADCRSAGTSSAFMLPRADNGFWTEDISQRWTPLSFLPVVCWCESASPTRSSRHTAAAAMAEEGADEANNLEALKRSMQYALIKNCDMNEEMRSDCVDAVISAAEKYVPRPSAARTRAGRRSRAGTRFTIFSTRRSHALLPSSRLHTGTRQTMSLRREWSRRRYACALSLARAARSHARSARSRLVPPALPYRRPLTSLLPRSLC